MQAKSHLHLVTSQGQKRAVEDQPGTRGVGRLRNTDYRKREHLTESEIEKLIEAAKTNRYGHRDATMIIVAYRHALRASELCDLTWDAIDFRAATMHVSRRKHGQATTHQISGPELKALRKLQREQESKSRFVFITERDGEPFNRDGFNWMVKRTGKKAGLPFQVHAHMLRHSAGYTLANAGKDTRSIQAYLGHRDIRHTVRYTELSPTRFKNFFPD
jgi:type 1 fimbriae regulatory protein FimB/type 1 fimbriae regulatory protein FimE